MAGGGAGREPGRRARVLGVLALEPDLYLLGPAGAYLTARLSRGAQRRYCCRRSPLWAIAPLAHREHPVFTSATFLAHVEETPASQDSIFTIGTLSRRLVRRSAKREGGSRAAAEADINGGNVLMTRKVLAAAVALGALC